MIRAGLALLAALALLGVSGCALPPRPTASASGTAASGSTTGGTDTATPGMVTCTYRIGGTPARPVDPPDTTGILATGTSRVTIDFGDVQVAVDLDRAAAPCAVHSFQSLVAQGFYDKTACHRLSTSRMFILQCGDPTGTGTGGPGYTFDDELDATTGYPAGVVAMASVAGADTNGSQFFFVYADSDLPPNYTVFGRMTGEGVQAIADKAFLGHDSSWGDGTGRPHASATIRAVVSG